MKISFENFFSLRKYNFAQTKKSLIISLEIFYKNAKYIIQTFHSSFSSGFPINSNA
jgi:hypothetical protein